MRTTIILNANLIARAQQLAGVKTKRQVIHAALRQFVQLRAQTGVRALRGKVHWDGNLDASRRSRLVD